MICHLFVGSPVLPQFYKVDYNEIDGERAKPHSQLRVASNFADRTLFLWGQSVYIISQLLGKFSCSSFYPQYQITFLVKDGCH